MRKRNHKQWGRKIRMALFDMLVIFSLLLNVWALKESKSMDVKIDRLGRELTTMNSTLHHATWPGQSLPDADGDEAGGARVTP